VERAVFFPAFPAVNEVATEVGELGLGLRVRKMMGEAPAAAPHVGTEVGGTEVLWVIYTIELWAAKKRETYF